MSGIYIHIPFCRQACAYCNFFFSTSMRGKEDIVACLGEELRLRREEWGDRRVYSIYFGGGTPSILDEAELNYLFEVIQNEYEIDQKAEVTLEANPDDLDSPKLRMLKNTPVNRLSIGIQSFFDEDLQYMNRIHSGAEADACIKRAQDTGFEELSIDLIYGVPTLSNEHWVMNLNKAIELEVPHLSAYALTVEPETALAHLIRKGRQAAVDDAAASEHFVMMSDLLESAGYDAYEISNFCKPGHEAKHNSSYWKGQAYLGIGPGAHSYDGDRIRRWNLSSNMKYVRGIREGQTYSEQEILRDHDLLNESIMTGLRTKWGLLTDHVHTKFGKQRLQEILELLSTEYPDSYFIQDGRILLNRKGKLMADRIASDLFITEEDLT